MVRVHMVQRPPGPALRYVDQVVDLTDDTTAVRFSQGVLTDFDIDVVHVESRELDLLLGTRGASGIQRLFAAIALVRNLRKHRIALVRTLHPTDASTRPGLANRIAQRWIDKATTTFIVLDESTAVPDASKVVVIPHADFGERFIGFPTATAVPGRLLCLAANQLPPRAESLLGVIRTTQTPGLTLRVAGIADSAFETRLRSVQARYPGLLSARLERLSDGAQIQEIDSAELIVLPELSSPADLQTVFLALSRSRPVLVPDSKALESLFSAIDPGWVHVSRGPINGRIIDETVSRVRTERRETLPTLSRRELTITREAYARAFRAAASLT